MGLRGFTASSVAFLAVAFAVLYQQSPALRLFLTPPTHDYTDNSGCTHIQGEILSFSVAFFFYRC